MRVSNLVVKFLSKFSCFGKLFYRCSVRILMYVLIHCGFERRFSSHFFTAASLKKKSIALLLIGVTAQATLTDKKILVIGEGHTKEVRGGYIICSPQGCSEFSTPPSEDHSNKEAFTICDDPSCSPDLCELFNAEKLPQNHFSEIYDARALFQKGLDSDNLLKHLGGIFAALKKGGFLEFQYDPLFEIKDLDAEPFSYEELLMRIIFPVGPLLARLNWQANPRAWIQPHRYCLDEQTPVRWNDETKMATIVISDDIDKEFFRLQLSAYVYRWWGFYKAEPYIVPSTLEVFERAAQMRFEKVEKILLEQAGFIEIQLLIQVNKNTHRKERIIRAFKPDYVVF